MSINLAEIRKAIARKRTLRGLTKYEEQVYTLLESGEMTDSEFADVFDAFVSQAELIYKREETA
jgi:hypothetical protein